MTTEELRVYTDELEALATGRFFPDDMAFFREPTPVEGYAYRLDRVATATERLVESADFSRTEERDAASLVVGASLHEAGRALHTSELPLGDDPFSEAIKDLILRDRDLEAAVRELRRITGAAPAASPEPDGAGDEFESGIAEQVQRVIIAAGEAANELAGSVAWSVVGAQLAASGRTQFRDLLRSVPPGLQDFVTSASGLARQLRNSAVRLIRGAVEAIARLIGSDALEKFIEEAKEKVQGWINDKPGGISGYILSRLIDADSVSEACSRTAQGATDEAKARALAAARAVADRAEREAGWTRWAAKIVGWSGALWKTPAAPYLAAAILCCLGMIAWQAQDALDTTEPFPTLDARDGIQAVVRRSILDQPR